MAIGQGWVCESYFGKGTTNNLIENCFSSGQISKNSGGICGSYTGIDSTNFTINLCIASGDIQSRGNGSDAGGILGSNCGSRAISFLVNNCTFGGIIDGYGSGGIIGSNSSNIKITNCSSSGLIKGGGITGRFTGITTNINSGFVEIIKCFSTGKIRRTETFLSNYEISSVKPSITNCSLPGGIVADYACNVKISECYSFGTIGGDKFLSASSAFIKKYDYFSCGGIIGGFAGYNGGSINISRCFSYGFISDNCGGIAASNFGVYSGRKHVIQLCYSVGDFGSNAGGIAGPDIAPGYETISSNLPARRGEEEAYVNILSCCSYGSLSSSSSSGGIIARVVNNTYPIILELCNYFVINLSSCKYYGLTAPIKGNVFRNSDIYYYSNNYGPKIYIDIDNSQIGIDSTIPSVFQYLTYNERVYIDTRYRGAELRTIMPSYIWTRSLWPLYGYEPPFDFRGEATGAVIKNRIIYGIYPNSLPTKITTLLKLLVLGYSVPEIIQNGYTLLDVSDTNLSLNIYNTSFGGNYTISSLLFAGFPLKTFVRLGMSFSQILEYGKINNITYTAMSFLNAGSTMTEIKDIFKYSIQQFIDNNFTPEQIIQCFTVNELINYGWLPKMFRIAKYRLDYLLHYANYDYLQLEGCNYSITEMIQASSNIIKNNSNTFWKQMIEIGYSPKLLLPATEDWAGLDAYKLPSIFTPADIARTTITPQNCLDAGYSRRQVATASLFGFSALQLRSSGFTLSEYVTVRGKESAAAAAAVAAKYTTAQIQAASIFYTQPPPLFKEIITSPSLTNPLYNDLTIYFTQDTNVSPDIICYVVSLDDGKTYRFVKPPKKGDPIRLRDITTNKIVSIVISSFNGALGDLNDILEMVPLKINTNTQVENAIRLIVGQQGLLPNTTPPPVMNYYNKPISVSTISNTVNSSDEQIDFSALSNQNANNTFLLVFNDIISELSKKRAVSANAITMGVATLGYEIGRAASSPLSLAAFIIETAFKIFVLIQAAKNAKQLNNTSLTFNKLDNSPTITSVTCINGTITVYFTIMPESGISLNNFSYSIDNSEFLLVSPKKTTSPLVITNSGVSSGENHNIRIRACDNRTSLYQYAYSKAVTAYTDNFSNPITIRAYSAPSNSFNFFANFANMAPIIIKMNLVSTQASTVDVSFIQDKVNSGNKITNYAWTSDGKTFNLLNPAKTTSPVRITVPSGTKQIALSSFNGFNSRYFSNWVSVISSNTPAIPVLSGVYRRRNGQGDIIAGAFSIEFPVQISSTPVIHYEYTINNGLTYTTFPVKDISFYSGVVVNPTNRLYIQLATNISSITVAVRAYNGVYCTLSKYKSSV